MSMTNEEAIAILMNSNEYHHAKGELPHSALSVEAFDMAIKALKTETKKCPNCGSDLYEYCFMCCYEGEKVRKNEAN